MIPLIKKSREYMYRNEVEENNYLDKNIFIALTNGFFLNFLSMYILFSIATIDLQVKLKYKL